MIRKLFICITFMLSLGSPAFAAPTNDVLVALLIQDYEKYDDACRGGSGDQSEAWVACGSRDYASGLLYNLDGVMGKQVKPPMNWIGTSALYHQSETQDPELTLAN